MAYQNMSSRWAYKTPVLAADFNQLGENDEVIISNPDAFINYTYKIKTGTITDNNTIALPSGWTQIDFAFVSINNVNTKDDAGTNNIICTINASFLVRCYHISDNTPDPPIVTAGTANYIIFGR